MLCFLVCLNYLDVFNTSPVCHVGSAWRVFGKGRYSIMYFYSVRFWRRLLPIARPLPGIPAAWWCNFIGCVVNGAWVGVCDEVVQRQVMNMSGAGRLSSNNSHRVLATVRLLFSAIVMQPVSPHKGASQNVIVYPMLSVQCWCVSADGCKSNLTSFDT